MMGKLANVIRFAITLAVGGNSPCTRASAAFTYCSVWNMSTPQLKNKSTSAEPRLVMERTSCSPGTLLTASSMGRNHAIPGLQSLRDLNLVALANSHTHVLLMSTIIGPHHHHGSSSTLSGQQCCCRYYEGVGNRLRQHGNLNACARF